MRIIFKDEPYVLMYGMLCSCLAAGLWLMIATFLKLPVSTTHTTVGAICGFAIFAKGFDAVNWDKIIEIIISLGCITINCRDSNFWFI